MLDKAFADEMIEIVRGHVERATAPLRAEIGALRLELAERASVAGEPGAPGRDGVDGRDGIDGAPGERGADGRDGRDGVDGRDAEPVSAEAIAEAVRQYLEANPPSPGRDGRDGIDGAPGERGADGRDGADGAPGERGADGRDGVDGAPGERGMDGRDGADGIGLAGAVIDRDGGLVITLTNGEVRSLGRVVGADGRDGAAGRPGERGGDGRDGFSLTDFDVDMAEDGRTVVLSFSAGDVVERYELAFPVTVYRGVYRDGETYVRGDLVTWAGSGWHCERETAEKPGEGSKDWSLAIKRGRDGRDAAVKP